MISVISYFIVQLSLIHGLNNGLVLTPPMGWLSWEIFGCQTDCIKHPKTCISENLFIEMADLLIKDGYKSVGYDRVNIDDCWMSKTRSSDGQLLADEKRFPHGIKFLSDYMHERGLKLGIYQNYGIKTCMGYPGLIGHSKTDAQTFAQWNVDMVKMDGCFTPVQSLDKGYIKFGKHLNESSDHPIVYSCSWPYYQLHTSDLTPNWKSISQHCNLWRSYHDIHANWDSILSTIDFAGDYQEILTLDVGPGRWNDLDMLLIGNRGLTLDQSKVQMGIWAILAAPLFMSNDLRLIRSEFKEILLNKQVIDVNQDPMGVPGKRIFHNATLDIWLRRLQSPLTQLKERQSKDTPTSFAIAFINRESRGTIKPKVLLDELGLHFTYEISDLFEHKSFGQLNSEDYLQVDVPATGIRLLKAELII